MIGSQGGSGPGWYYKGKPQLLHEAMNAEIDRLNLQNEEARKLLKRFLDAGPEEEYQVILCKLSRAVEAFLSGQTQKPQEESRG